ncbi:MAG TPA: hypothetical protein VJT08_09145 [Terriglobales bacterium]|nr:hypothetical protein [Terriglobales bacterium]
MRTVAAWAKEIASETRIASAIDDYLLGVADTQSMNAGLPTANAWVALFDHNGNQFRTSGTGESYSALFSASSTASGTPDCNPSSFDIFFGAFGNAQEITASSQPHFQSCTP